MKTLAVLILVASAAAIVVLLVRLKRRWQERKRVSEGRMASFVAQAMPARPAAPEQKLLFDAASKAAQAGEPALAIQLYARLLSRFPDTALAAQARENVEAQKRKLAKA
ncbi:MAG: hypothetical protein ACT4P4_08230 [Betaproteobacteria bacterium]